MKTTLLPRINHVPLASCFLAVLLQLNAADSFTGSTLDAAVGGSPITSKKTLADKSTFDAGQTVVCSVSVTNGESVLSVRNCSISDVVISNVVSNFNLTTELTGRTVGNAGYITNLTMRDVKVYGQAFGVYLEPAAVFLPQTNRWTGKFYDCFFQSRILPFGTWYGDSKFFNCTFFATNSPIDFSATFEANDDSTNEFYSCEFLEDGGTTQDVGYIAYARSCNTFHGCTFKRTKAPANASSCLLWLAEDSTRNVFYDCVFSPNGALAVLLNTVDTTALVHFDNCRIEPYTNGVCIVNNWPVVVRGGNLRPINFSDPSKVTWLDNGLAGRKLLASDGTSQTTSLANLGLSADVVSGHNYAFKCVLYVSESVASDGLRIDFGGGTATTSHFRAHCSGFDTGLAISTQSTSLTTGFVATTFTGSGMLEVTGSFEPSSSGTFIPRFAQNTHSSGTLTVSRGSHLIVSEMP